MSTIYGYLVDERVYLSADDLVKALALKGYASLAQDLEDISKKMKVELESRQAKPRGWFR